MPIILPILIFALNGQFLQADVGHTAFPTMQECHEVVDRVAASISADPKKPEGLTVSGGCLAAPPSVTGVAKVPPARDKSKDSTI